MGLGFLYYISLFPFKSLKLFLKLNLETKYLLLAFPSPEVMLLTQLIMEIILITVLYLVISCQKRQQLQLNTKKTSNLFSERGQLN